MRLLDARREVLIDLYLDFRSSLRAALASGDAAVVRATMRETGRQLGDSELQRMAGWDDERFQTLIARMTLADPLLAHRHRGARQWLRRHGFAVSWAAGGYGRPNLELETERRSA